MRKASDFVGWDFLGRISIPTVTAEGFFSPLGDHTEIGVQRYADCCIKRDLKRRSHILSPTGEVVETLERK